MERRLEASHTAMERKILDIKWQDRVPNKTVKERSKLPELMAIIMRQKWKWAGHVSRMTKNWAHDLTKWRLDHFLPPWLRTGWQSVISRGKIP